jgi:hypothetical protein
MGEAFVYLVHCPVCHVEDEVVVTMEVHQAGVGFLRQVAADKTANDHVLQPLSVEEQTYLEGLKELETTTDEQILKLMGAQ